MFIPLEKMNTQIFNLSVRSKVKHKETSMWIIESTWSRDKVATSFRAAKCLNHLQWHYELSDVFIVTKEYAAHYRKLEKKRTHTQTSPFISIELFAFTSSATHRRISIDRNKFHYLFGDRYYGAVIGYLTLFQMCVRMMLTAKMGITNFVASHEQQICYRI